MSSEKPVTRRRGRAVVKAVLITAALLITLGAVIWWAVTAWMGLSGTSLGFHGVMALTLGSVFTLLVGCGLMFLVFFSSRHGYDDIELEPDDF